MLRTALATAIVFVSAGVSRADTLPLIGVPSGYTPGVAFAFDVYAPGLSGLTNYTLQFTVAAGSPPNLPHLEVSASPPANLAVYPFPDTSNFSSTVVPGVGVNSYLTTIADATSGSGVNTLLGVNDHLATIAIGPGVNLSGPITVTFTLNEFATARDVGFDLPAPFAIPELPSGPGAVPAPPAWILMSLGALGLAARSRWLRAKSDS